MVAQSKPKRVRLRYLITAIRLTLCVELLHVLLAVAPKPKDKQDPCYAEAYTFIYELKCFAERLAHRIKAKKWLVITTSPQ